MTPEQQDDLQQREKDSGTLENPGTQEDQSERQEAKPKPKAKEKSKTKASSLQSTDSKKPSCDHDYVFHMSQEYQARPGETFVYDRCVKCNEISLKIIGNKK